ncbi:P-loop containing nucleoside triphosphate hydrolase protein, partial [Eremomyces bilateralis CBS 781.70]
LQRLGSLVAAETQMVLLTATLPPSQERILRERMHWQDEGVVIRQPTVRTNIRYSVVSVDHRARPDEQDAVIEGLVDQEDGKVVVYCNSRSRVERLARSGLGVYEAFHAGLPDKKKAEVLEEFRTGEVRIVVATSALGMGVDIPDIRLIVHADVPRNLIDFAQESGRAGRDGRPSRSIVVGDSSE